MASLIEKSNFGAGIVATRSVGRTHAGNVTESLVWSSDRGVQEEVFHGYTCM